jgi:hypothetical protein
MASKCAWHTAISIKVVHEQSEKVEYERARLLGIANKLMNFQSDSQQPFALVFDFSALLVDNLNFNEIAVYQNLSWISLNANKLVLVLLLFQF